MVPGVAGASGALPGGAVVVGVCDIQRLLGVVNRGGRAWCIAYERCLNAKVEQMGVLCTCALLTNLLQKCAPNS